MKNSLKRRLRKLKLKFKPTGDPGEVVVSKMIVTPEADQVKFEFKSGRRRQGIVLELSSAQEMGIINLDKLKKYVPSSFY